MFSLQISDKYVWQNNCEHAWNSMLYNENIVFE